jgi:hypothetical protein
MPVAVGLYDRPRTPATRPATPRALATVRRWTLITLALIVFAIFLMTTKPF